MTPFRPHHLVGSFERLPAFSELWPYMQILQLQTRMTLREAATHLGMRKATVDRLILTWLREN